MSTRALATPTRAARSARHSISRAHQAPGHKRARAKQRGAAHRRTAATSLDLEPQPSLKNSCGKSLRRPCRRASCGTYGGDIVLAGCSEDRKCVSRACTRNHRRRDRHAERGPARRDNRPELRKRPECEVAPAAQGCSRCRLVRRASGETGWRGGCVRGGDWGQSERRAEDGVGGLRKEVQSCGGRRGTKGER